ncbi:MAG: hypothetical protein R3B09_24090 [Nannocystaceae bacterium]
MRTIQANLNARTLDQCIRIPASHRELRSQCIRQGDRVRLTDGEVEVEARIEVRPSGPVAVPTWSTLVYCDA